jgi:hypothetical protein
MPINISGSIAIPMPRAESNFIARIVPALAQELRSEKPGAVTESSDRVGYRRGYNFLPFTPNRFSSFDPGEFVFEVAGDGLKINYRLGLGPNYLALVMVPICAGIAVYVAGDRPDVLAISGGLVVFVLGHIAWNAYMIRQWLRSVVMKLPVVQKANASEVVDGRVKPGHDD